MNSRTFQLKRFRTLPEAGGETLFFRAMGGDRRHPMPFFRPEEVPAFEGDLAWFLAERARGGGWRIVRRIDPDGEPHAEQVESAPKPGRPPGDK